MSVTPAIDQLFNVIQTGKHDLIAVLAGDFHIGLVYLEQRILLSIFDETGYEREGRVPIRSRHLSHYQELVTVLSRLSGEALS